MVYPHGCGAAREPRCPHVLAGPPLASLAAPTLADFAELSLRSSWGCCWPSSVVGALCICHRGCVWSGIGGSGARDAFLSVVRAAGARELVVAAVFILHGSWLVAFILVTLHNQRQLVGLGGGRRKALMLFQKRPAPPTLPFIFF